MLNFIMIFFLLFRNVKREAEACLQRIPHHYDTGNHLKD